jgi:hypothetical protein
VLSGVEVEEVDNSTISLFLSLYPLSNSLSFDMLRTPLAKERGLNLLALNLTL